MYFLAKGECDVFVLSEKKQEMFVRNLKAGALFGEVAIVTNNRRTATVKSKNYITVAGLSEEGYKEVIS
jgi:CRP-like cAMP-binding protein